MFIPTRVWTVICYRWSEVWFAGLPTSQPLADQVLNDPVAEEKATSLLLPPVSPV